MMAKTPLAKFFKAAVEHETSDLLLRSGQAPMLRLRGSLKALKSGALDPEMFEQAIADSLTDEQYEAFKTYGSFDIGADFPYPSEDEKTRFRVNIFRTRGRAAIAARLVSNEILTLEQLRVPTVLNDIAEKPSGIILLCGVTGSGKSTTIAAMLQHINETKSVHIVTLEDPIEYLFRDAKSMINQREIGLDCKDFETGLRALVRENPDVVLIGEMRDRETFEAALHAAETGHLVFGTIHASSASQAFTRIYDLFPHEERESIRIMLAEQMQAFVYQRLLPTIKEDVPRVPAVEILINNPQAYKYIMEGREHDLEQVMKNSREEGMQTLIDSLVELVESEYIHPRVAAGAAPSPEDLKMRLRGIATTGA